MSEFRLPDLGEGLSEAEIREWLVKEGDAVEVDQALLSVETDKAVVDVPSPVAGRIARLHGAPGDAVAVGGVLVEFADADAATDPNSRPEVAVAAASRADPGTVVGRVQASDEVRAIPTRIATLDAHRAGPVRAMPAVRALARELGVGLGSVTATGKGGLVTADDVRRAQQRQDAQPSATPSGTLQPLRGLRRAMALNMTRARDELMLTTTMDDAIVSGWGDEQDVMLRLIRALVAACRAEPVLNAWYDAQAGALRLIDAIDLGLAVDTPEGLMVVVLKDAGARDAPGLRAELDQLKAAARSRTVAAERLRGASITLSNYGSLGGRYATPVMVPPTVAIVGAGAVRDAVVALDGRPVVAPVLPLSLSFDHRCITGGEAARFMAALIADLQRAA